MIYCGSIYPMRVFIKLNILIIGNNRKSFESTVFFVKIENPRL